MAIQPDRADFIEPHIFSEENRAGERGTRWVVAITAAMMVVEIVAGWWFNSMALLADGWHMSSHAVAIGLSAFAYAAVRRYARDRRFAFGTWKIEVLAGFASAIFLIEVAATMALGSFERLWNPRPIDFGDAIIVAVLGLVVNLACALILHRAHEHHHGHHDHHSHKVHGRRHDDLNLRSAYLHVIADAATSVLAIAALLGGMLYSWNWLDPAMGVVGAVLVGKWAWGLVMATSRILLDREMDHPVVDEIRETIASRGGWPVPPRIVDLHVWRVGRRQFAAIIGLVAADPAVTPAAVRDLLGRHGELCHVSVEVNRPAA
ncbi:MAG: cation diffusion facilitator family transporter [Rhodocyclaceae bacterium]|nr:cation diffusion facilitator family transporter [Rhodocyclaceae bacterium]